jgi:hypothetical protein
MQSMTDHERQAYELGAEHARNAASWIVDGNTERELIPTVLEMIDNGDPAVSDYLPREPNLSGEYADDMTPSVLYREITGSDISSDRGALVDTLADAYEAGVSDTFYAECERILRAALEA